MAQVAPGPHALHSTTAATHISLSDTSKATDRKRKLEGQELAAFQQAGLASGLTTEPDQQVRILELADRKSFAAKQDSSTVQNILEDDNEALLWRWDLKDLKLLPKQHVRAAKERRKQWQQAQQRLNILSHANSALSGSLSSKTAQARLQKALDRIESVPRVLQARHAPSQGQSTDLTKEPATLPAHAAAVQSQEEVALPMELDQPATSSQKLAQQEAAAATAALKRQESEAKAAERACMKEEKAAEKQRMKNELAQEKEKAREKKAAEKAAELSSKKTSKEQQGFGDTKTFKKAQNVFKSFFRTPAKPAQASQDTSEQPAEAPVAAASQPTAGTSNQKPYHEIFRPPGRPPLYGSFTTGSKVVSGRRPLNQDTALDYEVMSDEDWESEPEGEDVDMVLRPDLVLTVPEDINASEPELPEKSSAGSACAQPKERPEDLLPELQSFLNANAAIKAVPKAAQAFMDAHPDRKMVKKWVMDKVKEFRVPAGSEAPQISLPDTAAKTEAAQRSLLSCLQQPHINQDKDDQAGSSLQMAQRIVAESNQGPAEASHTDLSNVQRANQGQAHALQ
ncbi:hypothetical protein WJX84_010312 [Apatococcus fuscideae]|uniref:Chromatin assembly factor 1 subunit A dimerization domain-containing protein n=1 Tax=Apatococcus fuscideae TaxID=2026836 RepID=A0AAW1T6K3_9CHLO